MEASAKSGRLLPALFTEVLAKLPGPARATMRGQELRVARELDLDDGACAGFVLDFAGQGARVEATVHGPGAALLAYALRFIAARVGTSLEVDEISAADGLDYLARYESGVLERRAIGEVDGGGFVAWLAREEAIALAGSGDFSELPLDDAAAAYEMILDSEAVEDVFVSERELARLLARYRASAAPA